MKPMTCFSCAAIAVATLLAGQIQAADGITLNYKGKKGDKLYFSSETKVEMTQSINGMDLETKFDNKSSSEREVIDVNDKGEIVSRHKTLRLQMNAEFPVIGEYKYDSQSTDNETGSQIGAILTPVNDALSGAVVDVTVSKLGDVTKVTGIQDIVKGLVANNPAAAQFTGGAATDEGAKLGYSESLIEFPKKSLKEGDTWETPYELAMPQVGKLAGKTIYKYEGTEEVDGKKLHAITFTTEMSVDVEQDLNGVKVTGKMEVGDSKGKALFDAERGIVVLKEGTTTISGDLNLDVNGMAIALKQEQTVKGSYKLLDKKP